jgi:hypothetical protein
VERQPLVDAGKVRHVAGEPISSLDHDDIEAAERHLRHEGQ